MALWRGANSIFYGCKLLTTPNPEEDKDLQLFRKLGLNPQQTSVLGWRQRTATASGAGADDPGYRRLLQRGSSMTWQQKIDDALTARRSADALRRRYAVAQGARALAGG
ncbi:biotin synthetase [Citrobacter koseri]|uniref:Biotin synthetase n=1 Tax=Citrobacter koseri TaxID=545 RepID=A0A2X2X4N8_CITKO|nr:biotin synthetase [Citrobacter koseri]